MSDKLARDLITYVGSSKASEERNQFLTRARKFWKLYLQREWWVPSEEAEPYPGTRPVSLENRMFEKIETLVSVFFKHLPVVEMIPYKPSDYDLVREQNKHIQYSMRETGFIERMREGSQEAFITGMNLYHTGWDVSKIETYQNGDCGLQSIPREDCFLDPMPGLTDIQRSRFVALRFWLPQEVILERWGEPAAVALGMERKSSRRRSPRTTIRGTATKGEMKESLIAFVGGEDEAIMDIFDPEGELLPVYEIWHRPRTVQEFQLTGKSERTFKRTDILGRVTHLVNGQVVSDKPNPFREYKRTPKIIDDRTLDAPNSVPVGHGQFPVVRQVCYQIQNAEGRRGLYDVMGILEQLESLQWDVNDLARQMMINARTIANPPTIVSERDLVHPADPHKLVLFPAQKIIVKGDRPITESVHIEQPASIPAYVQYLHQQKHQQIDQTSGVKGFVAGNIHKGTSHTTAEGTQLISEADFTMMWSLIRRTEGAMIGIVRQFHGYMQQFFRVGRFVNVALNGQPIFQEWTSRNAVAEFYFDVISGSSTPQQDVRRIQNITFALQSVQPFLQEPTADNLQLAIFTLEAANLPWTHEFLDWLKRKADEMEEQERIEEQSQLLISAAQFAGQNPQPQQGGISLLADRIGVTPEDLIAQLAS